MLRWVLARMPRGRGRLARAVRFVRNHPFVDVVEPAELGVRMRIDPSEPFQLECWAGAYQPHIVGWIRSTLRPGMKVLAAGLHIGYMVALARRIVGPTGWVLSAEPDPDARARAERSLALGGACDAPVAVLDGRLSDAEAKLSLYHSRVIGHSSFAAPHQPRAELIVRVRRGDDWLAELGVGSLDAILLNLEGWEMRALVGLDAIIAQSTALAICYEASEWALRDAGTSPLAIEAWLSARGFDVTALHGDDHVAARRRATAS